VSLHGRGVDPVHQSATGTGPRARPATQAPDPQEFDEVNEYAIERAVNEFADVFREGERDLIKGSIRFFNREAKTWEDVIRVVSKVLLEQLFVFKFNVSCGLILHNPASKEYRAFYPSSNFSFYEQPILVKDRAGIDTAIARLKDFDFEGFLRLPGISSGWRFVRLVGCQIAIYQTERPLGVDCIEFANIPLFIAK